MASSAALMHAMRASIVFRSAPADPDSMRSVSFPPSSSEST
jgi:hypothetical protein